MQLLLYSLIASHLRGLQSLQLSEERLDVLLALLCLPDIFFQLCYLLFLLQTLYQ